MSKNEERKISYLEAFKAMQCFLEKYWKETQSDDVASLCSDIQILHDNTTCDPAAWDDWVNCINKVIK